VIFIGFNWLRIEPESITNIIAVHFLTIYVTTDFKNISVSYDALCICEGKADDISILTSRMEWQTVHEDYLQLSTHDSVDRKSFFFFKSRFICNMN
jgi:hypothetical protein